MSAVEFAVRSSAGGVQRGFVGGVNANAMIMAQPGGDISLNLNQSMIQGYRRDGDMLRIALADGDTVVIDNFFDASGTPVARLFMSTNSVLQSVSLQQGTDGALYGNYAFVDVNAGKWSANDDLYFAGAPLMSPVAMASATDAGGGAPWALGGLALPLLGLLGLGTGAAVVLGSTETRDKPDTPAPNAPQVRVTSGTKETGTVVNRDDQVDGATISGTGTPNANVTVTTNNGYTQTVTTGEDGSWTVTIPPNYAVPGTYEDGVKVVITNEDGSSSVTQTLKVDTEVAVTFDAAKTGGDGIVNKVEQTGQVTLSGSVDAGSTVVVTINGSTYNATVTGSTWSLNLPAGTLATGEYSQAATVTATDTYGNTNSVTGSFGVDTVVNVTFNSSVTATDGVVNGTEQAGIVTLTGTTDAGATVTVLLNGKTYNATVSGTSWSLNLPAGELPTGEYSQAATVTARDAAGNSSSVSGNFLVDTQTAVTFAASLTGGDGVVNGAEQTGVVRLSGTNESGAAVVVTLEGRSFNAVVSGTNWTLDLPAGFLPAPLEGNRSATVTATDTYGNTAVTTGTFRVDTFVNALSLNTVEGDDIVNRAEASDGITLTGMVEAGSKLLVTFDGIERAATVAADGSWSVTYGANEVRGGEYTATVVMNATDAAGNTRSDTATFVVDTTPPDAPLITAYTRANVGVRAFSIEADFDAQGNPVDLDAINLHRVDANGSAVSVSFTTRSDTALSEVEYNFAGTPIPNGSHLVMTATDGAKNATSTLFVLEESNTNLVNLGNSGYDRFNIEAIDLQFAQDTRLELTAQDLADLSAHSNRLVVHGGIDDTVVAQGASWSGRSETIGGQQYNIYNFGSGGELVVDTDIKMVI